MTDLHVALCVVCQDRPAWAPRLVDALCYRTLRADLGDLAAAYDWLGECMTTLSSTWREHTIHSVPVEPPAPMQLHLADARSHIADNVWYWVQAVAEAKRPRPRPPAEPTVRSATAWLAARLGWIVRQYPVGDLARDISGLRDAASDVAPRPLAEASLPLPCPKCNMLGLAIRGGWDAGTRVACSMCRAAFSVSQYRQLVAAAVQGMLTPRPADAAT